MSSTACEIILYHNDPGRLKELKQLFAFEGKSKPGFGGYSVDCSTLFDQVVITQIEGSTSMDTDGLLHMLQACEPEWLFMENYYDQIGEKETICLWKGKKSNKKTLINNIRKLSKQADLYYALEHKQTDRVAELLNDDSLDPEMSIDGAPLLFHLMKSGSVKLIKQAVKRGVDIHTRFSKSDWFGFIKVVEGMNLLPIAIQMRTKQIFDLLIQSGIDVNAVDIEGEAPIHYALSEKSCRKFIRPLVEAGADINLEDGKDFVPIFVALGNTEYKPDQTIELAEEMIGLGADITHVGKRGTNALWIGNQRELSIVDFVKAK